MRATEESGKDLTLVMYGIMMSLNRLSLYNGEAEVRERR